MSTRSRRSDSRISSSGIRQRGEGNFPQFKNTRLTNYMPLLCRSLNLFIVYFKRRIGILAVVTVDKVICHGTAAIWAIAHLKTLSLILFIITKNTMKGKAEISQQISETCAVCGRPCSLHPSKAHPLFRGRTICEKLKRDCLTRKDNPVGVRIPFPARTARPGFSPGLCRC